MMLNIDQKKVYVQIALCCSNLTSKGQDSFLVITSKKKKKKAKRRKQNSDPSKVRQVRTV